MTTAKERAAMQRQFQTDMNDDELMNCMRCGFCLPTCPTYIESGFQESHSPRGRIALMKAVVDGIIEPDDDVERSLNMCLGCRACEPVCPSGVRYGHLLEEARNIIAQHKRYPLAIRVIRKVVFQWLFPHPRRLRLVTALLGFYQRSLQTLVHRLGLLKMFPSHLAMMERVLPKVPTWKEMNDRPKQLVPTGKKKQRVAFFTGCLMDTMFMNINDATMRLLQLAGCEVVIPSHQVCCGALHGHGGEKAQAKELAKRNIATFEQLDVDYIVTNAGGCGAFLVEYDHLLKDDSEWNERAKTFTRKIKDISEVLLELEFPRIGLKVSPQIVTYQDSCHLRNVMKVASAPRQLLQAIEGVEFREMKDADRCCGSAGIYNIVEPEMSMQILDYKMTQAKQTNARTIVTANPGCLLQMKLGIEREGLAERVRAVHIVEFLIEAIESGIAKKTS